MTGMNKHMVDPGTGKSVAGSRPAESVCQADLLAAARRVINAEAVALLALEERVDGSFLEALDLLRSVKGRVIVSGVGKSGIIGRKVAATLCSTGTPAVFLHPVEGLHGDLGIVCSGDVAIFLSKSGESEELAGLLEYFSRVGVSIIALTGHTGSSLAQQAAVVLDCSVAEEACPYGLAPTTSTTAALAMGDALAVALLLDKGFSAEDFARLHPGGALGRRISLRVRDVMVSEDYPALGRDATMRECVVLLAEKRGTVPIVDAASCVVGVVTAGDLTRLMEREGDVLGISVEQVMNTNPKLAAADQLAAAAVYQMESHGIMAMPVVNEEHRLLGMVHLHDLLRAGAG